MYQRVNRKTVTSLRDGAARDVPRPTWCRSRRGGHSTHGERADTLCEGGKGRSANSHNKQVTGSPQQETKAKAQHAHTQAPSRDVAMR